MIEIKKKTNPDTLDFCVSVQPPEHKNVARQDKSPNIVCHGLRVRRCLICFDTRVSLCPSL